MDSHEVFTEEKLFSKHMYEQHSDMTDTLKRPAIVALYERPLERATSACDFCALEETRALSATRLRRHLARHLEELALCVLQGFNSEKNCVLRVTVTATRMTNTPKSRGLMLTSMLTRSARTQDLQGNHNTIESVQTTTCVPLSNIKSLIDFSKTPASLNLEKIFTISKTTLEKLVVKIQ